MANVCACGCGELLPEGSTRQYKRGHKQRAIETPAETADEYTEVPAEGETEPEPLSLEEMADAVPDDPEPKDQPEFKVQTAIKITAAVRKDVEGKLAFLLMVTGQMWSMPDPVCGPVMLENSPDIAKKLTPIVCQSPQLVRWFRKTSGYLLYLDLLMACWPVLQIIFAHHIAKSLTAQMTGSANGEAQARRNAVYVVQ